jgi:hypothetical protein
MSTPDFFRTRLNAMVDLCYLLAVLAARMPWVEIGKSLAALFARKARMGSFKLNAGMLGPTVVVLWPQFRPLSSNYKGFPIFVKQHPAVVNRAAIDHGI